MRTAAPNVAVRIAYTPGVAVALSRHRVCVILRLSAGTGSSQDSGVSDRYPESTLVLAPSGAPLLFRHTDA